MRRINVFVIAIAILLVIVQRLPAPIEELSPTATPTARIRPIQKQSAPEAPKIRAKPSTATSTGAGASHWADLNDRNVIGEWQSCGPKSCTSTNLKPDHTFIFTNLSSGKIGYSGDWRTSGNMLLLHVTRTGTAPASVKGQTIPLMVMDLGPNKMYTRFPSGDTSKHLWTRRK